MGARAHVGDRCACSRTDQASSPVREGSEGQEMGWPRGHCQAGLLSRGQRQRKLLTVQLRLRERAGTGVESSHWGRFRLRQSWLGLRRPRRWESSGAGRRLLGRVSHAAGRRGPHANGGGAGAPSLPLSAFEARIMADHCCRFLLALEAGPSSEACTCDIHDLGSRPPPRATLTSSIQAEAALASPPRTLPNGPCAQVELRPHGAKGADGPSDVGFRDRRLPTHPSFHTSLRTKDSAGKPGPPQADGGTPGRPPFWARPCPLALRQPGPGQHFHCEARQLDWVREVSLFCHRAECLSTRPWN
nr:uncharacterized protein LOC110576697 [Neomonachus schauinslandi]